MPLLTIIITNYNTIDFVKLTLYAIKRLTKNDHLILINDNGSSDYDIQQLKVIQSEDNIEVNFRKSAQLTNSAAHGEALDLLIEKANTQYTVIFDSDCVPLMKYWDEYLLSKITDKIPIVGSPIDSHQIYHKPADFPLQFLALFDTKIYKSLNISCMPHKSNLLKDTCYEWREKYIEAGYDGIVLNLKHTRVFKDTPYKKIICSPFYTHQDELIACHFGRGVAGGIGKYLKWMKVRFFRSYLAKKIAINEKKKWIEVSQLLIDQSASN